MVNTSFNMPEEPIVRTAEEAVRAFESSKLDVLVLVNYILESETLGATSSMAIASEQECAGSLPSQP